jgi:inhibitor of cysteine peptidase
MKNQLSKLNSFGFATIVLILISGLAILGVFVLINKSMDMQKGGGIRTKGAIKQPKTINEQLAVQSEVRKFKDYNELEAFLEDRVSSSYGYYGKGIERDFSSDVASNALSTSPPVAIEESVQQGFGGGGDDYSTTNIQVQGVDEADIIKTDGEYIYAVSNRNLFILKAYPGQDAEILSTIVLESYPQGMYLSGERLAVYGQDSQIYNEPYYSSFIRRSDYTFVKVFDISDRVNPRQVRNLDFEGYYNNSRMIGDYMYFLTSTPIYGVYDDIPVPRILENGKEIISDPGNGTCERCPDVFYIDVPYQSYNYVQVASVNIQDESEELTSEVYLLSSSQNIYVSANNIYLTYTKWINEQQLIMEVSRDIVFSKLSAKDKDRVRKIEDTENFILSPEEKLQKIGLIMELFFQSLKNDERGSIEKEIESAVKAKYQDISKELEKTIIHRIAIDKESIEYERSGEVPGNVLNQFSMDEHGGNFRIATTNSRSWSRFLDEPSEPASNLYVLDSGLEIIGSVEGLAPGESIFSVRFMQNRAYMVTFEKTDPLFVIDVEDPLNPRVLGELKIPGFSEYLHPFDDTRLIGFGRDADEEGVAKGLKLSLFDVSDVKNPKEINNYIFGDQQTSSIALHDHHAFLFSREKEMLSVPVERFGAYVFKATELGFELKGSIDHNISLNDDQNPDYRFGYPSYNNSVQRSLYIDELLYTFSNNFLKINLIEDLSDVNTLLLKTDDNIDFEVKN